MSRKYIMEFPKGEHVLPHWETAIEWLILAGGHGGNPMVPHIAMLKALLANQPNAATEARQKACQSHPHLKSVKYLFNVKRLFGRFVHTVSHWIFNDF